MFNCESDLLNASVVSSTLLSNDVSSAGDQVSDTDMQNRQRTSLTSSGTDSNGTLVEPDHTLRAESAPPKSVSRVHTTAALEYAVPLRATHATDESTEGLPL